MALGILTGFYPAFYMTSFNMSRVLKGGGKGEGKNSEPAPAGLFKRPLHPDPGIEKAGKDVHSTGTL